MYVLREPRKDSGMLTILLLLLIVVLLLGGAGYGYRGRRGL
jgi:flagellar basal body-associated protein FliL